MRSKVARRALRCFFAAGFFGFVLLVLALGLGFVLFLFALLFGSVLGHPLLVLGLALCCLFLRLLCGSGCHDGGRGSAATRAASRGLCTGQSGSTQTESVRPACLPNTMRADLV